jgi:hypothetical protein
MGDKPKLVGGPDKRPSDFVKQPQYVSEDVSVACCKFGWGRRK